MDSYGFSGVIKLTNLDDFITPSQECIIPAKPSTQPRKQRGQIAIEGNEDSTPNYEKAKINLTDCLACSGCITSAEAVLVNQQSHEQLYKVLSENRNCNLSDQLQIVVSLSPQAIVSLAVRYNLTVEECTQRFIGYLKDTLGAHYVFDASFGRSISLLEAQKEFMQRYNQNNSAENGLSVLPMLAAACPGWVCFAEKTHGDFLLPFLSTTRSPQQVMGRIIKHNWAKDNNLQPDKLYHVTVMPCFDKKLEASRQEFKSAILDCQDVDCVITPIEVEQMLEHDCSGDLQSCNAHDLDDNLSLSHMMISHSGSSSGGYADYVFTQSAKELFGMDVSEVAWKTMRNPDLQEVCLEHEGKVLLRFARVYGFRNIQNLVLKVKRGKCPYHYVEVMACPSGCVNGGAQLRPPPSTPYKEHLQKLEYMYQSLPHSIPHTEEEIGKVMKYYSQLSIGESESGQKEDRNSNPLHTTYKAIPKNTDSLFTKW